MRIPFVTIVILVCFTLRAFNVYSQDDHPLLQSIKKNDPARVTDLLNNGADINIKDNDGDNVLMYAALYSTKECMQLLLNKGARPDAKNNLGETAIFWCSHDIEKTKLLIAHHADVNVRTINGNTPLLSASVGASQGGMIKLLLAHGADPKAKNDHRVTTLIQVAQFGDTSIARLLIDKGVEMEAKAADQQTALYYAIKTVNTVMVKWLVQNGADANALDTYKAKPISYAVTFNDIEAVKVLLSKTTDINAPDIDGMTILMWATYSEDDNPAIIQLLLDKGASPDAKDKHGETALAWALKKGNTKTVALLQKAGTK